MTLALLWPVSQDLERKEAKRVCSEGNDGCEAPEAPEVVGREARGSGRDLGALSQGSGLGEREARVPATAESGERAATAVGRGAGVGTGPGEKSVGCGRPSHQEAGPGGRGLHPLQAPDGTEPNGNWKRLRGTLCLCCSNSRCWQSW